jgi:S1-C subfamily serine protease
MLTGTTPFRSSTAQPWVVITKHINEPPADPRTIIPTLAKNSAEAIIKGLAKNIGQRYPSCARFVDAIKSNVVTTSHINQLPSQPNITAPTLVFNKVETIISSITCVFEKQPNSVYPLLTEKIEHTDEPINIGVTVKKHFPKKPIMIIGITSVLCVIILLIGFSKRENLSTDNNYNNLSNTNTTPKYNISRINTENNSKTNVDNPVPTVITTNPNNRGNRSTRQNYNQPTSYNYNTSVRKEPKQVYSETVKSILTVAGSSDYDMSLGSGFFVNNGIIATNEHVVRGNNVFVSRIIGEKDFLQFTNLRHANRNIDIAFLTVPNGSGNPLQLGDDNAISVGDTVYTIGNPEGYEGTFSTGIISAIRKNDEGTIDEIQFTAPTSSGSSGGPVLDINGKVIGIVYRGSTKGQNINLAIPVSKLKNYMSECGISYY